MKKEYIYDYGDEYKDEYTKYEKPSLKERLKDFFGDLKQNILLSFVSRGIIVRRTEKSIKNTSIYDTKILEDIKTKINMFELDDGRFGKTLSEESLKMFKEKYAENEKWRDQEDVID